MSQQQPGLSGNQDWSIPQDWLSLEPGRTPSPTPPPPPTPRRGGRPPAPGAGGPSPSRPSAGRLLLGAALVLLIVGAVAGGIRLFGGSGPHHPDEWDPRVVELVDFIETERGVPFRHPVHVKFLSVEKYQRLIAGDYPGAPEEEAVEDSAFTPDDYAAVHRALGLLEGEQDLAAAGDAVFQDGTAAYYDTVNDIIFVRGTVPSGELPPDFAVTVVHELTHAWQDQQLTARGSSITDGEWTTDRSDAMLAVLEGDATMLERRYVAGFDEAQLEQLKETTAAAGEAAADDLAASAGDLIPLLFSMPYQLGPAWVQVLLADGGDTAVVDTLAGDLPTTAEILGLALASGATRDVAPPKLADGAVEIDRDTWGAFSWVVPLAGATDSDRARSALSGWAGDSVLVSKTEAGVVCVDATVAFRDEARAGNFEVAATAWLLQLPSASAASISRAGDTVTLHTCDPGTDATVGLDGDAATAINGVAARNEIAAMLVAEGAPVLSGLCIAGELIAHFGLDAVMGTAAEPDPNAVAQFTMSAAGRCR